MLILEILLWLGLFSIFYTYLFYPKLIQFFARNKKFEYPLIPKSELPKISIVMAAHNEEKVIEQKIRSVFNGDYPNEKIEFLIGSDNSNDKTNEILTLLEKEYPTLKAYLFTERQGKINIINQLIKSTTNDIIISTDASNFFYKNTILELVSSLLSDKNIGMLDTKVNMCASTTNGIGLSENIYWNSKTDTKCAESLLFKINSRPEGGCFIFRKVLWQDVPTNFLVDDIFIGILVLKKNYMLLTNPNTSTFEYVNSDAKTEFNRKIRTATGNFQNFFFFIKKIFNPFSKIGFVMISHRVLRWFGPFILLFILLATIFLANDSSFYVNSIFYKIFLGIEVFSILICIVEFLFRKININLLLLRHLTHFYISQIAVVIGFWKYITGVKSSIWSPTNVSKK